MKIRKHKQPEVPQSQTTRRRGEEATSDILAAALALGLEGGFDALTVEGIAERSGVAKTTIYRRWPNVSAIIMDGFLAEVNRAAPIVEKATARATLAESMKRLVNFYLSQQGKMMIMVIARAQTDERLRLELTTRWVEPRRQMAREILVRGIERGELRRGVDPDIMLDILYGPLYRRFFVPHKNSAISDDYVVHLLDAAFGGLSKKTDRK